MGRLRDFGLSSFLCAGLLACASVSAQAGVTAAPHPSVTVARLQALYQDTRNDCREHVTGEPRGLYYCSGLLIRGVGDRGFLPWTFSPSAIARGGAPFSWLRHDVPFEELLYASGFILRNPAQAAATGMPATDTGFICIYPVDGLTHGNTNHNGCGLRTPVADSHPQPQARHHNRALAWGQCEALGITTVEQWLAFYHASQDRPHCAWNIDSPTGWTNAIALHGLLQKIEPIRYPWNELILHVPHPGFTVKDEIEAFFHTQDAQGDMPQLAAARVFQRRLFEHGRWVPIVRLSARSGQPVISYHPQEQAIAHEQSRISTP